MRADVLIFTPHPDDGTIACGGVIQQALAAGRRVHIVVFTNGDGYPDAAAALSGKAIESLEPQDFLELGRRRQSEELAADALLGLSPGDVSFLGYPDAGLDKVYLARGNTPFTQRFTQKNETYGPVRTDYHSLTHGRPAPYLWRSALGDAMEFIERFAPTEIYVSSEADTHLDHMAAFLFVRDAVAELGYRGKLYSYLVHTDPYSVYPWPYGATPEEPLELCSALADDAPVASLPWPPPRRVQITPEQAERKLKALQSHHSQLDLGAERYYLESFVKSEEAFWPFDAAGLVLTTRH